jgi:NADH-quinone oxidoreductase subunit L
MIYSAIVFLPGLGALVVGLFGRLLGARPSELITTGLLVVSCLLSWLVLWRVGFGHETAHVAIERWITSGELDVSWAFRIDTLTAVMFVVVTTVSALVHVYSIGYMDEDPSRPRFFAYLSSSASGTRSPRRTRRPSRRSSSTASATSASLSASSASSPCSAR